MFKVVQGLFVTWRRLNGLLVKFSRAALHMDSAASQEDDVIKDLMRKVLCSQYKIIQFSYQWPTLAGQVMTVQVVNLAVV